MCAEEATGTRLSVTVRMCREVLLATGLRFANAVGHARSVLAPQWLGGGRVPHTLLTGVLVLYQCEASIRSASGSPFLFVVGDVDEGQPRVRHMGIVESAMGRV